MAYVVIASEIFELSECKQRGEEGRMERGERGRRQVCSEW